MYTLMDNIPSLLSMLDPAPASFTHFYSFPFSHSANSCSKCTQLLYHCSGLAQSKKLEPTSKISAYFHIRKLSRFSFLLRRSFLINHSASLFPVFTFRSVAYSNSTYLLCSLELCSIFATINTSTLSSKPKHFYSDINFVSVQFSLLS